jgi:hypothetical protein
MNNLKWLGRMAMKTEEDAKAKQDARRDFLKKAAKAGVAAPAAVTLILAAGTKRAKAVSPSGV